MFRFWSSDARGSEKTVEDSGLRLSECVKPVTPAVSDNFVTQAFSDYRPKRRRSSLSECSSSCQYYADGCPPSKRIKSENIALLSPQSTFADGDELLRDSPVTCDLEDAMDTIQFQFGLEILLKHDELRLINQELAKCQVALEQLRRCHLIPYPVSCPTPQQMLDISSGKGPALQTKPGAPVPRWAPPFGVVDGPYARHYAKWLIPDAMFDGIQPAPQCSLDVGRVKSTTAEGRATRNSFADSTSFGKQRPVRGMTGQKLQALSSGYPQPKDKQGPCILKRSDGQTVKLVCIDCHRWDFSSTQGFINHCRIAHRRDFKSHEEAAVQSGHPIEVDDSGGIIKDEKPLVVSGTSTGTGTGTTTTTTTSGLVHPFARSEPITEQQAYASLRSRIRTSLDLYHAGKLPNVKCIPGAEFTKSTAGPKSFVEAPSTPYLSQLLQKRKFKGNLSDHVNDAKTKMDLDDGFTPGEDSEDADNVPNMDGPASPPKPPATIARTPAGVMRVPARTVVSPVPLPTIPRPASSKGRAHLSLNAVPIPDISEKDEDSAAIYDDDEIDVNLSPHTIASNNAPSLVSDDGEYDDSDDGSSSETSEDMDSESVSDVAEINIDEEDNEDTPRPIRHHRTNSGTTTVKLKKDEAKHVTFVTPITGNGNAKGRRKPKV